MEGFGGFLVVMWLFGLVLAIAWVILPFALIGTKPLLRELIREQRRTNELLEIRRSAAPTSERAPAHQ
jgi:hypothetical protein